jgi:hypothetical protein
VAFRCVSGRAGSRSRAEGCRNFCPANEADAGDYLGRDARRIDDHLAVFQNVSEAVF